jgi:hypothetical protein
MGNKATNSNQEFLKLSAFFQVVFLSSGDLKILSGPRAVRFVSNQGAAVSKTPTEKARFGKRPSLIFTPGGVFLVSHDTP